MSDWALAAPAAITGLVAAAGSIDGPDVHDGLVVTASDNKEAIVVAGSTERQPAQDQPYIEHKLPEPGYSSDVVDAFTVYSEIAVLNGDDDLAAARTRAYVIVKEWADAIAEDPTLGDAVMASWVSEVVYRPVADKFGMKAVLLVAVDCIAATGD